MTARKTPGQFHETVDVTIEPDCSFSCSSPMPKKLNEFGIPEKDTYRCPDLANVLGITNSALVWRFHRGDYAEVPRDLKGQRAFSIDDIRRLVARVRRWFLRHPRYHVHF